MMQYTAVEGAQGICPDDWHVPTDDEWKILEGSVDSQYGIGNSEWNGTGVRGYDAGLNLKVASGWISEGDGRNLFGFEALLCGYRKNIGVFEQFGIFCNFWTSTESSGSLAWRRNLAHNDNGVDRFDRDKTYGFSVRCLKD